MAKKFMVFDVEGYSTCRPYNIGWLVGDKTGAIFDKRSFAVMPAVYDNMVYKAEKQNVKGLSSAHEMFHNNAYEILNDCNGKYEKIFDIEQIFTALLETLTKYNIKRMWAYNCSFDESSFFRLFGTEKMNIVKNIVTFCDIIPAILYTKLLNEDYVDFCKTNGFLTEKGNIRTKAETVYRYLTQDLTFVEEHTGLADCEIEFKILLSAMAETKNPKRTPCQAWKVLQKFCESEGIYIPALADK